MGLRAAACCAGNTGAQNLEARPLDPKCPLKPCPLQGYKPSSRSQHQRCTMGAVSHLLAQALVVELVPAGWQADQEPGVGHDVVCAEPLVGVLQQHQGLSSWASSSLGAGCTAEHGMLWETAEQAAVSVSKQVRSQL